MCLLNKCRLCKVVGRSEQERTVQDSLLAQTDHFQWIPGLGAFVEGYSLIISNKHILNTGAFNTEVINELETFINKTKMVLSRIYKSNCIIFEHGSMGSLNHAGSCVEHHHIHIFPVNFPFVPKVLCNNFEYSGPINSMQDLRKFNIEQIPYIYYVTSEGAPYVFKAEILPRQYMRQVVATECGLSQDWDWREKNFAYNIKSFVSKVKSCGRIFD